MKEHPILFSTPIERLLSKRAMMDNDCWDFTGHLNPKGYGRFYLFGKVTLAHTASFRLFKGKIPDGYTVDHICRNRRCINPDHLEAVPHAVNLQRGNTSYAYGKSRTECKYGHPLTAENIFFNGTKRKCKTCNRIRNNRQYQNRKIS